MKQIVLIEYLPNYKVKFTCTTTPIKECEGGGWYSVVGQAPICYSSIIKHESQIPKSPVPIESLTKTNRKMFGEERMRYESSANHKNILKQRANGGFSKIGADRE